MKRYLMIVMIFVLFTVTVSCANKENVETLKTLSPSPIISETPVPILSETPSLVISETPTPIVSETPTPIVSETPTPIVSETPTPIVSETPTPTVSETPTPIVSESPIPVVSSNPTVVTTLDIELDFDKVYTESGKIVFSHILNIDENYSLISGYKDIDGSYKTIGIIIKIDGEGNFIEQYEFADCLEIISIAKNETSEFCALAKLSDKREIHIYELDCDLTITNTKKLTFDLDTIPTDFIKCSDRGYIIASKQFVRVDNLYDKEYYKINYLKLDDHLAKLYELDDLYGNTLINPIKWNEFLIEFEPIPTGQYLIKYINVDSINYNVLEDHKNEFLLNDNEIPKAKSEAALDMTCLTELYKSKYSIKASYSDGNRIISEYFYNKYQEYIITEGIKSNDKQWTFIGSIKEEGKGVIIGLSLHEKISEEISLPLVTPTPIEMVTPGKVEKAVSTYREFEFENKNEYIIYSAVKSSQNIYLYIEDIYRTSSTRFTSTFYILKLNLLGKELERIEVAGDKTAELYIVNDKLSVIITEEVSGDRITSVRNYDTLNSYTNTEFSYSNNKGKPTVKSIMKYTDGYIVFEEIAYYDNVKKWVVNSVMVRKLDSQLNEIWQYEYIDSEESYFTKDFSITRYNQEYYVMDITVGNKVKHVYICDCGERAEVVDKIESIDQVQYQFEEIYEAKDTAISFEAKNDFYHCKGSADIKKAVIIESCLYMNDETWLFSGKAQRISNRYVRTLIVIE